MDEIYVPPEMEEAIQVFPREDGALSIWDNPNFTSTLWIPEQRKTLTRHEQALDAYRQNRLTDDEIVLISVIGDAICVNEAQLRIYMKPIQSASRTSALLKKLRYNEYIQRHKCSVLFAKSDEPKPPGVFVLGVVGYKFLKNMFPEKKHYVHPDKWLDDSFAVQRYVAMNELRCAGTSKKQLSAWRWHPHIGGHSRFQKPFAVMSTKSINDQPPIHFILERVQMSMTFLDFLRKRLSHYRYLFEKDGLVQIDGIDSPVMQVVTISVSSVSLAEFIQLQLETHLYPFDVLFLIDELLEDEGELTEAFAQGTDKGIVKVRIPYFTNGTVYEKPETN